MEQRRSNNKKAEPLPLYVRRTRQAQSPENSSAATAEKTDAAPASAPVKSASAQVKPAPSYAPVKSASAPSVKSASAPVKTVPVPPPENRTRIELPTAQPPEKKKKPKKKPGCLKQILTFCITFILVLSILLCVPAFLFAKHYVLQDYTPHAVTPSGYVDTGSLIADDKVKNILLIGQDTFDMEYNSRSDTMMVVSVDTQSHAIRLLSFQRDTYIEIPGHDPNKMNASCAFGGPSLVIDTIEYNFRIRIDGYIRVSFNVLADIVDAVGGVTIPEITETEAKALYSGYGISLGPGQNIHLNGENAVRYCRIRQYQSDFFRTQRQRTVVTQLLKSVSVGTILPLVKAAKTVIGEVDSSLTESEIMRLVFAVLPCLSHEISQQHIPADNTWYDDMVNGQAVLQIDYDTNRQIIYDFLY